MSFCICSNGLFVASVNLFASKCIFLITCNSSFVRQTTDAFSFVVALLELLFVATICDKLVTVGNTETNTVETVSVAKVRVATVVLFGTGAIVTVGSELSVKDVGEEREAAFVVVVAS